MLADLGRYFYAALYGQIVGVSPKAKNFPRELAPDHRNWKTENLQTVQSSALGQSGNNHHEPHLQGRSLLHSS